MTIIKTSKVMMMRYWQVINELGDISSGGDLHSWRDFGRSLAAKLAGLFLLLSAVLVVSPLIGVVYVPIALSYEWTHAVMMVGGLTICIITGLALWFAGVSIARCLGIKHIPRWH